MRALSAGSRQTRTPSAHDSRSHGGLDSESQSAPCADCPRVVGRLRERPTDVVRRRVNVMETMPFGKHKGKRFSELDDDYLKWLTDQELRNPLKAEVAKELA